MKVLAILFLLNTTAQAAPLYLSCKGQSQDVEGHAKPEPVTISIVIDGITVKVEDLAPVQIIDSDEDIWTFGSGPPRAGSVYWREINRITGRAYLMIIYATSATSTISSSFDGECHKTEKRF
jgi:hypothetical protein